jgi:Family of unknown function (DUF5996)
VTEWHATRDTLQLWTQIIGKIRLAHSPLLNHWWNVPLYVTARGLTTSLMWSSDGRGFQIDFDFLAHQLDITVSDGTRRTVALAPRSVADFFGDVVGRMTELDMDTDIWTMPVEIEGAIPFPDDVVRRSYDRDQVEQFWGLLISSAYVFNEFRTDFVGKSSPVHLFWAPSIWPPRGFPVARRRPTSAGRHTAVPTSWKRPTHKRSAASATGPAVLMRDSSTPTPIRSPRVTGTRRWARRRPTTTGSSASSCCRTRGYEPPSIPAASS